MEQSSRGSYNTTPLHLLIPYNDDDYSAADYVDGDDSEASVELDLSLSNRG